MGRLNFQFIFDLWSKIKMGNGKLDKALVKQGDLDIEIFPPFGSATDDETKFQFIKISISKDFDPVPHLFDKLAQEYLKIANNYFLKTYSLIRLHTRQFLSENPKLKAIEQVIVTINDDNENQLFERMYATIKLRPIDENEFVLDQNIWNKVVDCLVNGKEAELYFSLLLDAKYHVFASRIREAIITTAVAIEQFTVEYLQRNNRKEKMEFTEFFIKAVSESKNKSIKYRKKDYHRLKYLFEARNNIAHGRGCYFNIGKNDERLAREILGPLTVGPQGRVEIDSTMCLAFADHMFALLDWIKND